MHAKVKQFRKRMIKMKTGPETVDTIIAVIIVVLYYFVYSAVIKTDKQNMLLCIVQKIIQFFSVQIAMVLGYLNSCCLSCFPGQSCSACCLIVFFMVYCCGFHFIFVLFFCFQLLLPKLCVAAI